MKLHHCIQTPTTAQYALLKDLYMSSLFLP